MYQKILNLNASCPNCVHLIRKYSVKKIHKISQKILCYNRFTVQHYLLQAPVWQSSLTINTVFHTEDHVLRKVLRQEYWRKDMVLKKLIVEFQNKLQTLSG